MNKEHIISVLSEAIQTNNFNLISQNLSFEEKNWLTSTTEIIKSVINELAKENKQILYEIGYGIIIKNLYTGTSSDIFGKESKKRKSNDV